MFEGCWTGHLGANNGAAPGIVMDQWWQEAGAPNIVVDQYGRIEYTATTRPDLDSPPDSPYPKIGHINCKPLTAPAGSSIPPKSGAKMKRDAAWVRHLESTEYYTKDGKSKQVQIDSRTIRMGFFGKLKGTKAS